MRSTDRRSFTEEDVDLLDAALVALDCPHGAVGPGHIGCTLACSRCVSRAALEALAAAGRLLPEAARRSGELFGMAFIYTDHRTGEQHVLSPADVTVVLHQEDVSASVDARVEPDV